MRKIFYLFIIVAVSLLAYSCSYSVLEEFPVEVPTDSISFATTIQPIFDAQNCTGCHPSTAGLDLSSGNSYASIMNGRVDLGTPENSKIYTEPNPDGSHSVKYTNQQALYVLTWIQQGANNN